MILNNEELVLLLSAAGITKWYGIDLSGNTDFVRDEKKVNTCLAGLYRKGLIEWGENKAKLAGKARQILDVLRNSIVCIQSSCIDTQWVRSGSYCNEGMVVVTERGVMDDNEIKLTLMDAGEWISMFERSGYFPKVIEAPDTIDPDSFTLGDDDLVSEFEVRSIPDGILFENLRLYDCGLYGVLIQSSQWTSSKEMFTGERIKSIMHSWAGGSLR